jgi:hypothetical protein
MRKLTAQVCITFTLLLVAALGAGCDKAGPPPEPLTTAELPAAMEKAFSSAKPEIKSLASQFVALVQAKDYPKAFGAIQSLMAKPGLTKEQVNVSSRASLTVNDLLQTAQAEGDQKAAKTIQSYQLNK